MNLRYLLIIIEIFNKRIHTLDNLFIMGNFLLFALLFKQKFI